MADMQGYAILLFSFIASIILVRTIFSKTRTKAHRLPPSPPAIPIIGHLHLLGPIPHQALHKVSTRYGPLVHFFIGSNPSVLVSSPEMAKDIIKNHETSFLNRPKMANFDYLTYGSSDFAMAPYGSHWKFMKKLCMTELLGTRTLDHLLPIRRDELMCFLKLILKKAEVGEAIDVGKELMKLTNNTISRMILSHRCSDNDDKAAEVRQLVHEMNALGTKFNLKDSIWFCKNLDLQGFRKRLKDCRDKYDLLLERIMKEHEDARKKMKEMDDKSGAMKDLLDILLNIYEDETAEMRLTREHIKAFIMNLFGAGTDTSSITIGWGLAELINNPHVMKKARQEIDSVVGKSRILEESDVANLPYLQAVVKETLRLHPGGPLVVRESTEDITIAGYDIPAHTRLMINVWSLGRDAKSWENPLEFKPERFLSEDWNGKSQWLDVRGQIFSLLPFGSGRRSCPGASLALQVVPTILGTMIQCFDWKVGDGGNGKVDMEEATGFTLLRAKPFVSVPVARLSPFPSI